MTLRRRTLLVLGLVVAGLCAAGFAVVSRVWLSSVQDLENERALVDLERVREAIDDEVARIDATAADWAAWDEPYAFLGGERPDFVAVNVADDVLPRLGIDALVLVDTAGRIRAAKAVDPDLGTPAEAPAYLVAFAASAQPLSTSHAALPAGAQSAPGGTSAGTPAVATAGATPARRAGLVALADGVAYVAVRPVLTSRGEGPSRGTLVLAHRVRSKVLAALARRTRVEVGLSAAASAGAIPGAPSALAALALGRPSFVAPLDDDRIASYAHVLDVYGRPGIVVCAVGTREVYREGRAGLTWLLATLFVAGAVLAGLSVILLERHVLSRLQRLGGDVAQVGAARDLSMRVRVEGSDELATMATTINSTLDDLESAVRRREESEAALAATESRLADARRLEAVGRLAGGVAHDFNNQLTVVLGYAEMLARRFAPGDPARIPVDEIRGAAESAAALTAQLLAFSRRQPVQPQPVDVASHLEAVRSVVARVVGEDVVVRVACEPSLDPAFVDPAQLTQILVNLAANARDAMPRGGSLTLAAASLVVGAAGGAAPPGRYVRITVTDDGAGMDAETASHVFEPFFTTKRFGQGPGLGLASVHGIVHQAGGVIEVESSPGRGTTFRIVLPCADRAAVAAPRGDAPASTHVAADGGEVRPGPAGGTESILLVEDEDGVRSVLDDALTNLGYRVTSVAGPEAALALVAGRTAPFECLVTDVLMPHMKGPELARRLLASRPDLRVVYVSGYPDDPDVRAAIASGAAFVSKPFTVESLAREVRRVLGRSPTVAPDTSAVGVSGT